VEELAFLANYDQAKEAIQDVVDMPDRKIDLLFKGDIQQHQIFDDIRFGR